MVRQVGPAARNRDTHRTLPGISKLGIRLVARSRGEPDFQPRALARLRIEQQVAAQRPDSPLDAHGTQPQQFQLVERVLSAERKTRAVVFDPDLERSVGLRDTHRYACGRGMLLDVIQRFTYNL